VNDGVRKFYRVRRLSVGENAVIAEAEDIRGPFFRDHPVRLAAVDAETFLHPAEEDGLLFVAAPLRARVWFVAGDRLPRVV
jgi:hypothetical protein